MFELVNILRGEQSLAGHDLQEMAASRHAPEGDCGCSLKRLGDVHDFPLRAGLESPTIAEAARESIPERRNA